MENSVSYIFIGLVVGVIMSLTGAGGALISIPMFIHLAQLSLKEATVLSLISVLLSSSVKLVSSLQKIDKKLILILGLSGIISNYSSLGLKKIIPDLVIFVILATTASYALYTVWKGENKKASAHNNNFFYLRAILSGAFIGLLTTITGLGGGVILIPILIKQFNKSYEEALSTSIGTIFVISLSSFLIQFKTISALISPLQVALMAIGVLIAYFSINYLTKVLKKDHLIKLRKGLFTVVTLYAVISIFIRSL